MAMGRMSPVKIKVFTWAAEIFRINMETVKSVRLVPVFQLAGHQHRRRPDLAEAKISLEVKVSDKGTTYSRDFDSVDVHELLEEVMKSDNRNN